MLKISTTACHKFITKLISQAVTKLRPVHSIEVGRENNP